MFALEKFSPTEQNFLVNVIKQFNLSRFEFKKKISPIDFRLEHAVLETFLS